MYVFFYCFIFELPEDNFLVDRNVADIQIKLLGYIVSFINFELKKNCLNKVEQFYKNALKTDLIRYKLKSNHF